MSKGREILQRFHSGMSRRSIALGLHVSRNTVAKVIAAYKASNIPQEMLDRIFEQFYRLDSSRSTQTGGSGLGLAIARQLIEAHGGTITAGSQDERIWFVISLPVRKS